MSERENLLSVSATEVHLLDPAAPNAKKHTEEEESSNFPQESLQGSASVSISLQDPPIFSQLSRSQGNLTER